MFREGTQIQARDGSPRFQGRQVAVISLVRDAYLERTSQAPDSDYRAEGLEWLEQQGIKIRGMEPREFWDEWKAADELVYVVRFRVIKRLMPVDA